MRTLRAAALNLAGAVFLVSAQSANAVPVGATTMKEAAAAASPLQPAQYYERHGRHFIVKCYRELVVGPYRCHRFYYW